MNLCGRPPYQKGQKKKKSKDATASQRARWEKLRSLGCVLPHLLPGHICRTRITIHHLGTGGGGRKNHDDVCTLCEEFHTGQHGIDRKHGGLSKRGWQEKYVTEQQMREQMLKMESEPQF